MTQAAPHPEPAAAPASIHERRAARRLALGPRLKQAREAAGLLQDEVAQQIGHTAPTHISQWESNQRPLPLDLLPRLCDLYGVTADYILGLTDDPDRDPVAGLQRLVAQHLMREMRAAALAMAGNVVDSVRASVPALHKGERLAGAALEVAAALQRLRERRPDFEDLPASRLVLCTELAATAAKDLLHDMERVSQAATTHPHHPHNED